jgi:hypothetical protein
MEIYRVGEKMTNTMAQFKGKDPKKEIMQDMSHRHKEAPNEIEVRELQSYMENDSQVYHSRLVPIFKNLQKKKAKGIYQHELAVKVMMYAVNDSNKNYKKDFGYSFSVPVRKAVARNMVKNMEAEFDAGNRW